MRAPLLLALLVPMSVAAQEPARIGVHALWLEGRNDENRPEIDRFFDCLIGGSTLNQYWQGEAGLAYRGSAALAPPPRRLGYDDVGAWLRAAHRRGEVPRNEADDHSVYVLFSSAMDLHPGGNYCGTTQLVRLGRETVGLALVRNHPHCWPATDRLRTETQVGMHELVEVVDRVLGWAPCAGDGACEGRRACGEPCENFVGLWCPGAPESTWTGCDGGQVRGWVIQSVASEGRRWENCETCMTCDFVPEACPPDAPDCAAVPPRTGALDALPRWTGDAPPRGAVAATTALLTGALGIGLFALLGRRRRGPARRSPRP